MTSKQYCMKSVPSCFRLRPHPTVARALPSSQASATMQVLLTVHRNQVSRRQSCASCNEDRAFVKKQQQQQQQHVVENIPT